KDVDRRPNRHVGAHGRIEGDQRAFHRVVEARARLDNAVENRLAVFHLADLEVDRVAHGLDEIAGIVNQEQPKLPGLQLAGEDEGGAEIDVVLLEVAAVDLMHLADGGATARAAANMDPTAHRSFSGSPD